MTVRKMAKQLMMIVTIAIVNCSLLISWSDGKYWLDDDISSFNVFKNHLFLLTQWPTMQQRCSRIPRTSSRFIILFNSLSNSIDTLKKATSLYQPSRVYLFPYSLKYKNKIIVFCVLKRNRQILILSTLNKNQMDFPCSLHNKWYITQDCKLDKFKKTTI